MRMNKHLLRISICLWLCLFTFISTWGEEVPFNHKGASEKWTSKTIAPITVESNGTGQTDYIKILVRRDLQSVRKACADL